MDVNGKTHCALVFAKILVVFLSCYRWRYFDGTICSLKGPWLFLAIFVCLFVCFVALRPKSTAMVMAGRSVHLTRLFPRQA